MSGSGRGKRRARRTDLDEISKAVAQTVRDAHATAADVHRKSDFDHRMSIDACRFIEACREYAQPGKDIDELPGGAVGDLDLLLERVGANPKWEDANERFCRGWLDLWVQSVPSVLHHVGFLTVQELDLPPAAGLTRDLYLRLLRSEDPKRDVGVLLPSLMALRVELGDARFELHQFFQIVRARTRRAPRANQKSKATPVPLPAKKTKKRGKGGRPQAHDPERDRRIADRWATGRFPKYVDLERDMGLALGECLRALNRYRKRRSKLE